MIATSLITSGFDVELQLGANWFRTALNLLISKKLLGPPGVPIIILNVQITFEPGWDLQIDVLGLPEPVFAKAELNSDGDKLILSTSLPEDEPREIPFDVLKNLQSTPVLVKHPGDAEHEAVIILLANLKIHAEPQNQDPFDISTVGLPRGTIDTAQSFLPLNKDVAFGMSKETFKRFANNIWHTQLRADDGTHPLPDAENKKGDWEKVTMSASDGKIKIKLEGNIPVDSPIIDVVPDPHVTITLNITPKIENGVLSFSVDPDTDVDTGLLGDIFGAITGGIGGGIVGGIIGFIVGLVTGGILATMIAGFIIGAAIGVVVGVIVIEVAEVIVEGIVQKEIKAKLNGEQLPDLLCGKNGVVQIATPNPSEGFNLSVLDSIPASIPIHTDLPANEFLFKQSLLVTSVYDDFTADGNGFAIAGTSGEAEKFQPEVVSVKSFNYVTDSVTLEERLESITYRNSKGDVQTLSVDEVIERTKNGELKAPFKLFEKPDKTTLRIPEGKLACVTLKPVAISEDDTVVKIIEFENGLRLRVPDAVKLQDAAAIIVTGFQLIHPKDYNAYYRAKADFFKDNNFESLPQFKAESR